MGDGKRSDGMTRRTALKTMGGVGLGAVVAGASTSPLQSKTPTPRTHGGGRRDEGPNLLFIMTDDHATSAVGAYGGRLLETPNLDRLAEEGARFENCFVLNSLCCPSRATMLTGKYAHLHGVRENIFGDKEPFDGSQTTYPKLLREAGYRTALVGKWHLGSRPTGFDYWNVLPGQGRYRDPRFIEMGERRTYPGYVTDVITDRALETLDRRLGGDRPFALLVHHKAPHRRWVPEKDHRSLFTEQDLPVPATFNDDYFHRAEPARHADMRVEDMPDWKNRQPGGLTGQERKHWNYQRFAKEYLRTIASVDEGVGRLLDYLEETGRAENTMVIYTTDNGFFVGEHGWFDKRFMYEESIRIPLLVRYPRGVEPGTVVDETALNLDFAETFLDYAGGEIPDAMQGRSLRPLLEGREVDWRDAFYYHYYEYPGPHRVRPHYGVRTRRHKLVRYYTVGAWELFDLHQDPHELNSVHEAPAYRGMRKAMTRRLAGLRRTYRDDSGEPLPS